MNICVRIYVKLNEYTKSYISINPKVIISQLRIHAAKFAFVRFKQNFFDVQC